MKHRSPIRIWGPAAAAVFGSGAPLWAASAAQKDNSDLFIWIFLGFCALIIVAQLIPALLMLLGFSKGVKKSQTPPTPDSVNHLTSSDA